MNLRHIAARSAEDADGDDEDVVASTTTEEDSDDDGSQKRMLYAIDAEAEESEEDDDDDGDEAEAEPMDETTTVPAPLSDVPVPVLVIVAMDSDDEEEEELGESAQINRARRMLLFKCNISEADVRATDFAIDVARCTLPPFGKITGADQADLCAAIRKRKEAEAARALLLVQQAQASNKAVALSTAEKVIFVQVKAMLNFPNRFEPDVRKRIYHILNGRSEYWWAKHNASALAFM